MAIKGKPQRFRPHIFMLTMLNIAKTSLLHPGKAIEIDKATGSVTVISGVEDTSASDIEEDER